MNYSSANTSFQRGDIVTKTVMSVNPGRRRKRGKTPLFHGAKRVASHSVNEHTSKCSDKDDSEWVQTNDVSEVTKISSKRSSNRIRASLASKESPDTDPCIGQINQVLTPSTSTPIKVGVLEPSMESFGEIELQFIEAEMEQGICPEERSFMLNTSRIRQTKPNDSKPINKSYESSFSLIYENVDNLLGEISSVIVREDQSLSWLPEKFWKLLREERGISELYDWQKDCLRLAGAHRAKNLIYSLPTSGGKTLVAEIIILEALLARDSDALLVLPYVSLVQEKMRGLSTMASELGFCLEEYAGSKGALPPRKRRRHCLYVCTIEKANSLTSSLQDEGRLSEIGLVVVDELHMIGEEGGRGACLEICLAKIMHCESRTRIVGMSATLANLEIIATFLNAELYTSDFRPVTLKEYFKLGPNIFTINMKKDTAMLQLARALPDSRSRCKKGGNPDPDNITALVTEVIPEKSCLIFCASKVNCQNVLTMIATQLPKDFRSIKRKEKIKLLEILSDDASGVCPVLRKTIPFGLAYHHSGLTIEERKVIEEGFLSGTLCLLTCTSTLAAGVNLPASRVIIRSPYTGNVFLTRTRYLQMVGRAGRAGFGEEGESIVIGDFRNKREIMHLMSAPLESCASTLLSDGGVHLRQMLLAAIGSGIANTPEEVERLMSKTFLASCIEQDVIRSQAIEAVKELHSKQLIWAADEGEVKYYVTCLGKAVYKSSIELDRAAEIKRELEDTQSCLVLTTDLQLIYLVIAPDLLFSIKPDWKYAFNCVTGEGEELLRVAMHLKVNPGFLSKLMTGSGYNSSEQEVTYRRFYLSLLLHQLVVRGGGEEGVWRVAEEFNCSRGFVQSLLASTAAHCSCLIRFSEHIESLWPLNHLLPVLMQRVAYASKPELIPLMELSGVGQGRARQLLAAGYKSVKELAKVDPFELEQNIHHLNKKQAAQIVASAKLSLQEKAEALREEAEELLTL